MKYRAFPLFEGRSLTRIICYGVIATPLLSCIADKEVEPTLESIQANIFDRSCLGCHGHENPLHGVDLSEGFALENMLYVTSFMEPEYNLIEPGDPDNSLLVLKLEGTAVTASMPMFLPLLPKKQVAAVRTWIENMPPIPQPTLTYLQKNVFDITCAVSGCHDSTSAEGGLDLSKGNAPNNMLDVPSIGNPQFNLIEPGDPNNSYLVRVLEQNNSDRMPLGLPPLSPEQLQAVRGWITTLTGPQPTLEWIQENVFNISCAYAGCHDAETAANGLDLSAGATLANTVNVPAKQVPKLNLITPGNPDDSYLFKKLLGEDIQLLSMPFLSPKLSDEKITAIRTWITDLP